MQTLRPVSSLKPADFRGFSLDVAGRAIVREWNRCLRPYGLSYIPYFVLLLIDEDGVRPSDLAAELRLDASSLSGHLERLESAGLAARRADASDRRVTRVELTERGRALLAELEPLGRVLSALEPGTDAPASSVMLNPAKHHHDGGKRRRGGAMTTLRVSTLTVPQSTVGCALARFADLVAERSDGAIRVALDLPATAAGGELQALVDVRSGDLAIAAITMPVAGILIPGAQLAELPYLLDDAAHARAFFDGAFGTGLALEAERFELAALGVIGNGFRSVTARTPVRDPEDLAGVRLRVQQSPINVHLAEALGAIAVPIPFPRLADALAAGEIDAQENALANIAGLELWRHQPYLSLTRHTFSAQIVLANAEILAALGSGAALVREAMHDAVAQSERDAEARERALTLELGKRLTIVDLDTPARVRFVEATRLVRDRVARALGDDAVARALAAAAAARSHITR